MGLPLEQEQVTRPTASCGSSSITQPPVPTPHTTQCCPGNRVVKPHRAAEIEIALAFGPRNMIKAS